MAFCSGCGTEVSSDVAFCPKCGKSLSAAPPPAPIGAGAPATTGLQENVAGFLCYILGWVTGLIFFLIDKRPFVRFHAMQSMITFGALFVLQWVFFWGTWFGGLMGFALLGMLHALLGLAALVCWILLMVKAHQGQRFKLPVIGDLAENYSK
jgi:uncharacterized membrane protein